MTSFRLRVMAQVLPFLLIAPGSPRRSRNAAEPRRGHGGDEGDGATPIAQYNGNRSISCSRRSRSTPTSCSRRC